ncbi:MAG: metallophosphoesterase family protein [Saprospiraceae bacterium]
MKKYAISDIHGCNDTFKNLLDKIGLNADDQLFLLGDYIDRGKDSAGVIDTILQLKADGYQVHCLRGNHEQMMIEAADDLKKTSNEMWLRNGGKETLHSYYGGQHGTIPDTHLQFLDQLSACKITNDFLFVHARLNFDLPNPLEDRRSMLWIRNWYKNLNRRWLGDRIIVHGHTPKKREVIEQQLEDLDDFPVLNIDNGCVFNYYGMGNLCAFNLTDRELTFLAR